MINYLVPVQTSSVFVVVTDRTPADLSSIIPWRMGPSHRRAAREALGTPRLTLEAFRATRSPWRRMDLGAEDLRRVRRARHHVVVTSTAPVEEQPEAAQVARAAARGVAEACHGTVYDPLTGTAVFHCAECPGERLDFDLGDDWLGWRLSCADGEHACALGPGVAVHVRPGVMRTSASAGAVSADAGIGAVPTDADTGCSCLVTTSRGLRRFGLPEITVTGLACTHSLCAVTALRTVAEPLLAGHLAWLSAGPRSLRRGIARRLRVAGMEYAVLSGGCDPDDGPVGPAAGERGCAPGLPAGSGERFAAGYANRLRREDRDAAGAESVSAASQEESGFLHVRLTPDAAARACLKLGLPGGHDGTHHPQHTPGLLVA